MTCHIRTNGHKNMIITSGRYDPPSGWRACLAGDVKRLQQLRQSRTSDMSRCTDSVRSGRRNKQMQRKKHKEDQEPLQFMHCLMDVLTPPKWSSVLPCWIHHKLSRCGLQKSSSLLSSLCILSPSFSSFSFNFSLAYFIEFFWIYHYFSLQECWGCLQYCSSELFTWSTDGLWRSVLVAPQS
jgi:hypothetical protein